LTRIVCRAIFAASKTIKKFLSKMETKEILRSIREKNNLTQEQFAERINVTRQAVSRWENGETQPNTEILKVLSKEFGVSINTLLGSPLTLYCQCCGMPLSDDSMISHEPDGTFNEDYCKWCYADGNFVYKDKNSLIDFLISHIPNPDNQPEPARRKLYDSHLSMLKHWR
jgi:transcriptional regulator with XRE-family HTH domain